MDAHIRGSAPIFERVKSEILEDVGGKIIDLPRDLFGFENYDHPTGLFSSERIVRDDLEIMGVPPAEP